MPNYQWLKTHTGTIRRESTVFTFPHLHMATSNNAQRQDIHPIIFSRLFFIHFMSFSFPPSLPAWTQNSNTHSIKTIKSGGTNAPNDKHTADLLCVNKDTAFIDSGNPRRLHSRFFLLPHFIASFKQTSCVSFAKWDPSHFSSNQELHFISRAE